jgi:hypothetical protein
LTIRLVELSNHHCIKDYQDETNRHFDGIGDNVLPHVSNAHHGTGKCGVKV